MERQIGSQHDGLPIKDLPQCSRHRTAASSKETMKEQYLFHAIYSLSCGLSDIPFLWIGPEWLPRFSLMPCLLSMRNTELRLLKPLALHTSSMGWPATYRLMTVFSLSSFCIFADETGGSDTIIFSFKLATCSADLRRARNSSGKTSITSQYRACNTLTISEYSV